MAVRDNIHFGTDISQVSGADIINHYYRADNEYGTIKFNTQGNIPVTFTWWENNNKMLYTYVFDKKKESFVDLVSKVTVSNPTYNKTTSIVTFNAGSRMTDAYICAE